MALLTGILLALVCAVVWAVSEFVTKLSLDREEKWKVLFHAQLFGGLIALALIPDKARITSVFSFAGWYLLLLGALNALGMYFLYRSVKAKGIALTSPINNASAVITVILGVLFYKESPTLLQWLAMALIMGSILALTLRKEGKMAMDKEISFSAAAMGIWGVFIFLMKQPSIIFGPLLFVAGIKLLTACFSVPALIRKKMKVWNLKRHVLLLVILLGLVDGGGFLALSAAMAQAPVSIVSVIASASPALSVLLGVLILKEKLDRRQTLGILGAIFGILLIAL